MYLPWSKLEELSRWLEASSDRELGMSFSSVGSGTEAQPISKQAIILQSPKVSVAIEIRALRRSRIAKVTVERTCINDALEPWLPFWRRFREVMKIRGFVLKS
jgi:hypothetical protein